MKNFLIITVLFVFFTGCGGSSSTSSSYDSNNTAVNPDNNNTAVNPDNNNTAVNPDNNNTAVNPDNNTTEDSNKSAPEVVQMILNQPYQVLKGDEVHRISEIARIIGYRSNELDVTSVVLIEGNAVLYRYR